MSDEARLGDADASARAWFRRAWSFAPLAAALALATSYVLYVCYRQYKMLFALHFLEFDMSNYHQKMWLLSRFREPFLTTRGLNAFGDHASFIDVLFVPIYWIVSTPLTLLWGETIVLGLAGLMVYLIAKHRLQSAWMGVSLSAAFFLYPALHYLNFENYRPTPFAVLFFLMFWYGFQRNNKTLALVSAVLLLSVKEGMASVLIGTSVYLYVFRKWKPAAKYIVLALTYAAFTVFVLMPYLNKAATAVHGNRASLPIMELLRGQMSLVQYAEASYAGTNAKYLRDLFFPLGLVPALSPLPVLLNPIFYFNMATKWPYAHSIQFHYTDGLIGSIFVSLIEAIAFIARAGAKCRIRRSYAYLVVLALLSAAMLLTNNIDQEHFQFRNMAKPGPGANVDVMADVASLKNRLRGKTLSVHNAILPFFSDRLVCYLWPNPMESAYYGAGGGRPRIDHRPEYVVLPAWAIRAGDRALLRGYGYEEDVKGKAVVLYRSTRPINAGPDESLYDAAVRSEPGLSNEVLARSIAEGVRNRVIFVDSSCGVIPPGSERLLGIAGKVDFYKLGFERYRDPLFKSGLLVMQYAVGRPEPTEAEYEIIRRYVANGGRLLLMCPAWVWLAYDKKPLEQLPYRRIAEQFGLKVESEYAKPPLKTGLPPFKADGVGDILQLQGTYSVISYPPGSGATPVLVGSDGKAAAVAAELGKARIIVWGQDNLLSAEAAGRPGAVAFVGQAVKWLLSGAQNGGGIDASAEKTRPAEEPR